MAKKQITKMIKGFFSAGKTSLDRLDDKSDELDGTEPDNRGEVVSSDLAAETVVGRYKIIRKLGQGAAGVVYLGRDPYIKRQVAIKISQPTSENARERFFIEAQSAGKLNRPNIVAIYDAGTHGSSCYIAMEYVEGPTLENYCNKENLLPVNKVVEIIFRVCIALDYAHKQGVIHKDIKPSNIMLDKGGTAKITDFGIAQISERTVEMGFFGTPSYMSPEQLKDEVVGSESDIFSLGCVLYELLTGQQTFSGDKIFSIMYKITNEEPESVRSIRPDIPKILEDIIQKALSKNIKERYHSCMDFAYDLRVAFRGLAGTVGKVKDVTGYIHNIPFFNDFTKDQVKELVGASNLIKAQEGKIIVAEGEIDDTFYIVLSGRLKVRKSDEDIAFIDVGQCFGEMSFIGGQARTASVVADGDCVLIKISATLLDKSSESIQLLFYKNFAITLVHRLSKKVEKNT